MTRTADPTVSQALRDAVTSPALEVALDSRAKGVPALGRLSSIGRRVVARQTVAALGELLDVDLLSVAEKAWCTHDRLVAAGYRTAARGGQEVVELGHHTVRSTHHPTVDLVVNGAVATTIEYELALTLEVASLVAAVRGGFLVAVHPGPCTLTAALSCEDVPLPSGTATVTLPGRVDLGRGHRLVPETFLPARAGDDTAFLSQPDSSAR